jgi:ethanolamine ammonia-lyase small subunit
MIDRKKIEDLVRQALRDVTDASGEPAARRPLDSSGTVLLTPDRGVNLGTPADPGALAAMLAAQPARIAQVLVIYGDGLSAAAINEHLEAYHHALERELAAAGLRMGPAFFVRYSRVKVMDEIARLVDAESALFVCGERPGLGFADSLSAYYIYKPGEGATDAHREVISNINPRGVEPTRAAKLTADALARILRERKSGVIL